MLDQYKDGILNLGIISAVLVSIAILIASLQQEGIKNSEKLPQRSTILPTIIRHHEQGKFNARVYYAVEKIYF